MPMSVLELIGNNSTLFYILVATISVMVGSFLNVVIHRLPIMMERAWLEGVEEFNEAQALANGETRIAPGQSDKSGTLAIDEQTVTQSQQNELFNLAVPRSRCPSCNSEINALQNIPIVSYLFLRG